MSGLIPRVHISSSIGEESSYKSVNSSWVSFGCSGGLGFEASSAWSFRKFFCQSDKFCSNGIVGFRDFDLCTWLKKFLILLVITVYWMSSFSAIFSAIRFSLIIS